MGARDLLNEETARDVIQSWWAEHICPAPLESMAVWAEQFREIAKGPEKGRWRNARTPYLVGPMEAMSEGSPFERVVMIFATQMGKTEVAYNTILQRIHRSPLDMMMVQPTLQDAKDHSRERFMPTVRRMPEVMAKLAAPTSRDESATWQTKSILGGSTMFFAGANSARSLASKPLGLVVADEVDGWPLDVDGEGRPLDIVAERMSNFPNRKMLICSTPTIKGFSLIENEYLASDRRRYQVPCPHCAAQQVLEWGTKTEWGLKWLRSASGGARPETAVYICRHCGAAIEERRKSEMMPAGLWVPEVPGAASGKVAGFQLSKLYSPLGWRSWSWMVAQWEMAVEASRAGDHTKMKTFVNTNLAETYEDAGERTDEHALRKRAEPYPLRMVPAHGLLVTAGADVQGDRIEAYAYAWGRGEESWCVDHQVFYGDPSLPENEPNSPWRLLTDWRRLPLSHASGASISIRACAIDSGGHHTEMVYRYTRRHAGEHCIAVKGSSLPGRAILGKPSQVDINHRGRKIEGGAQVWLVGTDTAKHLLHSRLQVQDAGPGFVHFSGNLPGYVFEQITAERIHTRYVKGHAKREWVKPNGRRNEALDCTVYAMAAAWYVGVHRHTEHHWQRYEARIRQADLLGGGVDTTPTAGGLTLDSAAATIPAVAPSLAVSEGADQATEPPAEPRAPPKAEPAAEPPSPNPPPRRNAKPHLRRAGWAKRW